MSYPKIALEVATASPRSVDLGCLQFFGRGEKVYTSLLESVIVTVRQRFDVDPDKTHLLFLGIMNGEIGSANQGNTAATAFREIILV